MDKQCLVDKKTVVECDTSGDTECLTTVCVPETGACIPEPALDGAPCDDDNFCTLQESCKAGLCSPLMMVVCVPDGKVCTDDDCVPEDGCVYPPEEDGLPCDDGDLCTQTDACAAGACAGFDPVACNDDDACTDDACVPETGECDFVFNSAQCDDGDFCTTEDTCQEGVCTGLEPVPGCCHEDADCDDDDPCTADLCGDGNECVFPAVSGNFFKEDFDEGGLAAWKIGSNNEAVTWQIDGARFFSAPNSLYMGNTQDHTYDHGNSKAFAALPPVEVPLVGTPTLFFNVWMKVGDQICLFDTLKVWVNDELHVQICGNTDGWEQKQVDLSKYAGSTVDVSFVFDTVDSVKNAAEGVYVDDVRITEPDLPPALCCQTDEDCEDGNDCTENVCTGGPGGVCTTKPVPGCCENASDCDDYNVCTDDFCDVGEGSCFYLFNEGPCDDGDICTGGDACKMGACAGEPSLACDDGNECTDDVCDPESGCVYLPNEGPCDDGDSCSVDDSCSEGFCKPGPPLDCDDDNGCTLDACNPDTGCVHFPKVGPCDDGDACTTGDSCAGGECIPAGPLDCDDGNDCTLDSCDPDSGCLHENKVGPCDDGNPCTANDICVNGICVGGEFVPGCCNSDEDCDDGWPCTIGICKESGCVAIPADCDDGNDCTGDTCYDGECHNDPLVQGQIVWAETFDDGFADAWGFTSNSAKVGWQVDDKRFVSEPNSLYMGNPAVHNYQDGDNKIDARAWTPPIHLPEAPVTLRFQVWAATDTKEYCPFDVFRLLANEVTVFEKCDWNTGGWQQQKVDLAGLAGEDVVLEFRFYSTDGLYNNGEGFYIDDLQLVVSGDVDDCCDEDTDCDDGDVCTLDVCDESKCTHEEIEGCPEEACFGLGESYNELETDDTCCPGLVAVADCFGDGNMCICPGCPCFVCTECGDGICGLAENPCNCPQDC